MVQIIFDLEKKRSSAIIDDTEVGYCQFQVQQNSWEIQSTRVLEAYRGQGIARLLVEKVIKEAKEKQVSLTSTCWYASQLLDT